MQRFGLREQWWLFWVSERLVRALWQTMRQQLFRWHGNGLPNRYDEGRFLDEVLQGLQLQPAGVQDHQVLRLLQG